MKIERFLPKSRIVDLSSKNFKNALAELLKIALPAGTPKKKFDEIFEELLERDVIMPKRIGGVIALPHVRAEIPQSFIFAVGRLPARERQNSKNAEKSVPAAPKNVPETSKKSAEKGVSAGKNLAEISSEPSIIFLVLASKRSRLFHSVLAELVRELGDEEFLKNLSAGTPLKDFRNSLGALFKDVAVDEKNLVTGTNLRVGNAAQMLALGAKCDVLLFFADTFFRPTMPDKFSFPNLKIIVVSSENNIAGIDGNDRAEIINVRSFSNHRMSQLRAALFIGLMRGEIKPTDRICCLGGNAKSDNLDTILLLDAGKEFQNAVLSRTNSLVPAKVRPEVLERVIALATELAVEGREGKPIGTMLIIGEKEKIRHFVEPLIINPFAGYSAEDRNILNPFMAETVKELAMIDGAFVIDGNGVIDSAGSNVVVSRTGGSGTLSLPGGLGTRHAAGCAISKVADCAAIVVSASGQITLFRNGEAIILLERSLSRMI